MPLSAALVCALLLQDAAPPAPSPAPSLSPSPALRLTRDTMVYGRFNGPKTSKPASYEAVRGMILFKMLVGGKEAWALLDNGADRSIIDEGFAREAGLTPGTKGIELATPTGRMEARQISQVPLVVPDNFEVVHPSIASADLGAISRWTGRKVDLVFGADLMKGMAVLIDKPSKTLRLLPSGVIRDQPTALLLPLSEDPTPLTDLMVDGKTLRVQVDLGSNAALVLTPRAWARVGSTGAIVGASTAHNANGTAIETTVAKLPRVTLVSREVQDVEARVRPWPVGDGAIGMGLMSRYQTIILDLKQRKLWLLGDPEPPATTSATAPGR